MCFLSVAGGYCVTNTHEKATAYYLYYKLLICVLICVLILQITYLCTQCGLLLEVV